MVHIHTTGGSVFIIQLAIHGNPKRSIKPIASKINIINTTILTIFPIITPPFEALWVRVNQQ